MRHGSDGSGALKSKLAPMPPDVLERNLSDFADALGRLNSFADNKARRSIPDLAQNVNMTSTWARVREDISQRARDFHDMEEYIVARRQHRTFPWVRQWWHVKTAQRRVVRDTGDIAELLARAHAHRESEGWAIYNEYGPMRDLVARHDALSEQIVAAENTIVRKIDEINEMIQEFMDMIPSVQAALDLNDQNDAIMEPLIAHLDRLVRERDALAKRMYDYEVARRRFLHLPPLETPRPEVRK